MKKSNIRKPGITRLKRAIDNLAPDQREELRDYLARPKKRQKAHGETLTKPNGNGYNTPMEATTKRRNGRGSIGRNIAEKRESLGISQEDLAAAVGISRIQVSRIENGHQVPRKPTLHCIAEALGLTSQDLRVQV
jgi:ribosome-binding protein aMBF1 (putative translation factor)